jgi:hypothetical protein
MFFTGIGCIMMSEKCRIIGNKLAQMHAKHPNLHAKTRLMCNHLAAASVNAE